MTKILIIDDNDPFRRMLKTMLEKEGYEVRDACNGKEGILQLQADPVDLVITDILMPDMDGVEMLVEMQRSFPEIKVVTVSGGGDMVGTALCVEIAQKLSDRTFTKPLEHAEFTREIRSLLNERPKPV